MAGEPRPIDKRKKFFSDYDITQEDFDFFLKKIDVKKLSRDYLKEPLQLIGKKKLERPTFEDFKYLFIDLNLPYKFLCCYFLSKLCCRWSSFFGLKKDPKLVYQNGCKTRKDKTGFENTFQNVDYIRKCSKNKTGFENIFQNVEYMKKCRKEKLGFEFASQSPEWKDTCIKTNLNKRGYEWNTKDPENEKKKRKTSLEHYGVETWNNLDFVKEKFKNTCIEKFGTSAPAQNEDIKKKQRKTFENHKNTDSNFLENIRNKRNYTNSLKSDEEKDLIKQKSKETKKSHYGEHLEKIVEKFKETCMKKYGVSNPLKFEPIREKSKETCLKRYGYENITQTIEFKEIMKKRNLEIQEKRYKTRKQHNTFHTSKSEEEIYQLLFEKFPDVKRQYRDERYPFACDFYIPSKDLFIEYQGTWTHGGHPFDENNPEDLKIVAEWKRRSEEINFKGKKKSFYKTAIYVWTKLDVEKRKYKNSLNWVEFFRKEDIERGIENDFTFITR